MSASKTVISRQIAYVRFVCSLMCSVIKFSPYCELEINDVLNSLFGESDDVKDSVDNELKSIALETISAVKKNGEKLDKIDEKVSKLRKNSKSRSRYSDMARNLCWAYWDTATSHEQIWRNVETRVTFAAVFNYYESQLKRVGVTNEVEFKKVVRAEMMRRSRMVK